MTCWSDVRSSKPLRAYARSIDLRHRVVPGSLLTYLSSARGLVFFLNLTVVHRLRGFYLPSSIHGLTIYGGIGATDLFSDLLVTVDSLSTCLDQPLIIVFMDSLFLSTPFPQGSFIDMQVRP